MRDRRPAWRLGDIVARLGGEVRGDVDFQIRGVGSLAHAGPEQAAFLAHAKYRAQLSATRAGALVLPPAEAALVDRPSILTPDPYGYFARLSALLNPPSEVAPGVHPSAVVEASASVHPSACIGAFVRIGHGAEVGAATVIEAGVIIGDDVRLGAQCRLHANVVIYQGCRLGDRVILHAGAVIGADGFGFAPIDGRWVKIPQVGIVVIGDDVEVGANTTIDRGALDDTVIEEGVKLDNQIQIGHNCRIGAHTAIAGCVGMAGSTVIGKGCRIGGSAMFTGHLEVADGVDISGGTVITKSVREKGVYTALFPFTTHERWLRNAVQLRNLQELAERVAALEAKTGKDGKA